MTDQAMLLLEVGPGNALSSLARLTIGKDGGRRVFPSLSHPAERRSDLESTLETTGRLWVAGAYIDWQTCHADSMARRVPLPTYPWDHKRYWVDAQRAAPAGRAAEIAPPSTSVDDWLFAPTWMRDDVGISVPRLQGSWLVLAHAARSERSFAPASVGRGRRRRSRYRPDRSTGATVRRTTPSGRDVASDLDRSSVTSGAQGSTAHGRPASVERDRAWG